MSSPAVSSIMSSYYSIFASSMKLPPFHPDRLIQQRGYDEADRMMEYSAYRAPMSVKRYAVLHKPWRIKSSILDPEHPDYERANSVAAACQWHHDNIVDKTGRLQDFRAVLYELTSAFHIGFSVLEKTWRYVDSGPYAGQWGFSRFTGRPARQIGFELDKNDLSILSVTSYTPAGGYQYRIDPQSCVIYTYCPENGLPYGRGDFRACYKHWWILNNLEKFHAIALERFGGPFMVIKGPVTDSSLAEKVMKALYDARQGADIMLPDGIEYEMVTLGTGALESFEHAKQWHAEQIRQLILGGNLMMSQSSMAGSYSLGSVHAETMGYFLSFCRQDIQKVWRNQVLLPWTIYNYGPDAAHMTPVLDLGDWDNADREMLAKALDVFLRHGVVYKGEGFIREMANFPPMDEESRRKMEEDSGRRAAAEAASSQSSQESAEEPAP